MYLSGLRVLNYSSFSDSGNIELAPGINLFVGPNNCGKSALLRAIVSPMPDNPHRSNAEPTYPATPSSVELRVCITVEELVDRLLLAGTSIAFPMGNGSEREGQAKLQEILNRPTEPIELEGVRVSGQSIVALEGASIVSLRDRSSQKAMLVDRTPDGFSFRGRYSQGDTLLHFLESPTASGLFYFGPQRVNVGRIGISDEIQLKADASNLPTVLAHVQNTRAQVFEQIEQHLAEVLPGVERITVVPSGGHFEIFLWPERRGPLGELRFSLNDSGSGVGQLLALICAIVLHKQAVIVVDEINTYLHPAAIKKLLRLMQSHYPQHQYIVSAHSSDVIFGSNAARLFTVRRDKLVSEVSMMQIETARDAKNIAGLLGFSMLDVFGNDRLLWVEGPTEELLFPLILEAFGSPLRPEIGICAVGNASSFSSKTRRDEVIAIYENAGKRLSPLLQGMAFGLDREKLTDEAVAKLQASKRKLRFLPRRCVENYFLIPASIAAVLQGLGEEVSTEEVEDALLEAAGAQEFGSKKYWKGDISDPLWLRWIDAPKLLSHLFRSLTNARQEFRKTRDTIDLARSALKSNRDSLKELFEFIYGLVKIAERDTQP